MSGQQILCSLDQAAVLLGGISPRTVRRLADRGELATCKVGRRLMIVRASIDEYVQSHTKRLEPWNKGKNGGIGTGSTGEQTLHTGGPVSPIRAADELGKVLGLPIGGRPRRFSRDGGWTPTVENTGENSQPGRSTN